MQGKISQNYRHRFWGGKMFLNGRKIVDNIQNVKSLAPRSGCIQASFTPNPVTSQAIQDVEN